MKTQDALVSSDKWKRIALISIGINILLVVFVFRRTLVKLINPLLARF
jgi:hypothetical protein